jgi:hypothetical protein
MASDPNIIWLPSPSPGALVPRRFSNNSLPLFQNHTSLALEMGNLRSLKREPETSPKSLLTVPNVTFSGYGLPLYPERERPPPCGKNSLELGFCDAWVRTGFLEARSGSLRKLPTVVPKIPLPWLHLRPSRARIDLLGLEVAFFRPQVSCSIIFFLLYPSPCLAPVDALVHHPV